jgi:dipeptidyl aminopeptidase/acylaminoacyl peptidase
MKRMIVFGLMFLSVRAFPGEKRALQLDDMFAMKRIGAPAVSPDGKWVAYQQSAPDLAANKNFTDLWISQADGGAPRQLTNHPSFDGNPVWSPDGKWILFESARSGATQLWLIAPEGGEPRQLTTLSTGASGAVWSPDGASVAYISEVYPEYSALPFRTSDSLNARRLDQEENGKVKGRVFTQLYYRHWDDWTGGKRKHIFIQPVAGGEPKDLTPGDRDASPKSTTFSAGTDFDFSPDGKEIAYTASPLPTREEAWRTNYDIYTVPVAGGAPRQITTNPAADSHPRYSPDGKYIAYSAQRREGYEADRWELMLYDRERMTAESRTGNADGSFTGAVWSPDARRIYCESEHNGAGVIMAVPAARGGPAMVVSEGTSHNLTVPRSGDMLVYLHITAVRPGEVYRCTPDGTGARPVTGANDALFAGLDIPRPTPFWFTGAGGTRIHSWLYLPPGFDRARRYPLVYMVHGGPQNAWLDSWSFRWNPPLWAAQGYVIVAPNPRGSTGFGQKFTDEISGDWGGKVFVDLMKGLDTLCTLPFVDSTRKAAAGASFGGYMMNWFLGNTGNRFRAIVSHDGVYNFESNYGTTDEVWFDEWDHGGSPWEHPGSYARFSPHRYAANFSTPTLVIHGEKDYRVPVSEGMQLFTALQKKGVPSKFLYFPDEGHWVLKPGNSRLWHTTVFDWLDSYLHK